VFVSIVPAAPSALDFMLSERVYDACRGEDGDSVKLKALLEAHPDVDVNQHKNQHGCPHERKHVIDQRAIHATVHHRTTACLKMLLDAKADLEVRDTTGMTPLNRASQSGALGSVRMLIDNKADVMTIDRTGCTPPHMAAYHGHSKCLRMLLDAKADVNVKEEGGITPVLHAIKEDRLTCLQLLVDRKADLSVKTQSGHEALAFAMVIPKDQTTHRAPGMPFAILSCNTGCSEGLVIDNQTITRDTITTDINEYSSVQKFIDECHTITKHALSEDAVVDTRVGRGDYGLYHEPLEQVLLYLGMSMAKDQIVCALLDDGENGATRALMPGHPTNANLWYELYQRTHCSSCSTQVAKPKNCPCHTARYCNGECQRKHWKTHKPTHKAVMLKQKK
jgi:ankyrin repeat protein